MRAHQKAENLETATHKTKYLSEECSQYHRVTSHTQFFNPKVIFITLE